MIKKEMGPIDKKHQRIEKGKKRKNREESENGNKKEEKKEECRVETVMFVPHTPGGLLMKIMQKTEDKFCKLHGTPRVRKVERGGIKIEEMLCKANPWGGGHCGREDCLPCEKGEGEDGERARGRCQTEGLCMRSSVWDAKGKGRTLITVGKHSGHPIKEEENTLKD